MTSGRDNRTVLRVISSCFKRINLVPAESSLLIIGAAKDDVTIARLLGFENITTSNLDGSQVDLALDAEAIDLPNNSYDVVFAHAVLHHCRSPHQAVLEAVRVCRKHFIFREPNDSLLMRFLGQRYEFPAVIANGYTAGGVRNTAVPNHIYRWSRHDLEKTINTGFPERQIGISVTAFFDLYGNEFEFNLRPTPVLALAARLIGVSACFRFIRSTQTVVNAVPVLRDQGNYFFAAVTKLGLHPWIEASNGKLYLRKP